MAEDLANLLDRARNGEAEAFDQLLVREGPFLTAQVQRRLDAPLRTMLEPEDVLQHVHLRIVEHVSRANFISLARFRAWLSKVVQNTIIDLRRRHLQTKKRGPRPLSLHGQETVTASGAHLELVDRIACEAPSPSSVARKRENLDLLDRALGQLKPAQRDILQQVLFEDTRQCDVATRDGRSAAAVRKEFARALQACRAALDRLTKET